ncbi:MAG: radical SAM family heme chaperone HemW [Candidatus Omnitrophota bacterium]
MRGLYIHIPFCHGKCHYCNFISISDPDQVMRRRIFLALNEEMNEVQRRHGRFKFDTVYFGGGTPSILGLHEIKSLVNGIRDHFDIASDAEITCEWNPGDGDGEKPALFRKLGVNRISLGCQSFRDEILKRLGRRHTTRDIVETAAKIRKAGITNISFDLMLRLPGQTLKDFRDSVRQCIELEAAQVSLYDLEVHEETLFGRFKKERKLDLPGEEEHAQMYENAIEMLTSSGYEHYEISNFSKPGLASRHNLIYWHNEEYLGLGPGAFTYLNGIRSQFALDLMRYLEKCETGDWKNDAEDKLSEEEKETETLITGLRLREGVSPEIFSKIYPSLRDRIHDLSREGLLEETDGKVRLTDCGKFLSEDVFAFLVQKEGAA